MLLPKFFQPVYKQVQKPNRLKRLRKDTKKLKNVTCLGIVGSKRFGGSGKGELKKLTLRRKSASEVAKITGTMKLVAAVKVKVVQRELEQARPFFESAYEPIKTLLAEKSKEEKASETKKKDQKKRVAIIMSTDKGLCGPINAILSRNLLADHDANPYEDVVLFGEKAAGSIPTQPSIAEAVRVSSHASGKNDLSFLEFADIVDAIEGVAKDVDEYVIYYTHFINVMTYQAQKLIIPGMKGIMDIRKPLYEYERSQPLEVVLQDLVEFNLGAALNYGYYQTLASEMASRQNSMENATKNAEELMKKLKISFNKVRQAVITTELVEINSGKQVIQARKLAEEEQ